MSYLYAGLGIAMLSGIIAMMQIGNKVDKYVNLMSEENQIMNDYIDSDSPSYDKDIIKILYQDASTLPKTNICEYVVNKINENKPPTFVITEVPSNKFFRESCSLEKDGGNHRIVINQTYDEKYELFSCSKKEKVGDFCKFENGDKK